MTKQGPGPTRRTTVPAEPARRDEHPAFVDPKARSEWHHGWAAGRRPSNAVGPKFLRSRGRHTG